MKRTKIRIALAALLIAGGLQTISCMAPATESLNNLGVKLSELKDKFSELNNANAQLTNQIAPLLAGKPQGSDKQQSEESTAENLAKIYNMLNAKGSDGLMDWNNYNPLGTVPSLFRLWDSAKPNPDSLKSNIPELQKQINALKELKAAWNNVGWAIDAKLGTTKSGTTQTNKDGITEVLKAATKKVIVAQLKDNFITLIDRLPHNNYGNKPTGSVGVYKAITVAMLLAAMAAGSYNLSREVQENNWQLQTKDYEDAHDVSTIKTMVGASRVTPPASFLGLENTEAHLRWASEGSNLPNYCKKLDLEDSGCQDELKKNLIIGLDSNLKNLSPTRQEIFNKKYASLFAKSINTYIGHQDSWNWDAFPLAPEAKEEMLRLLKEEQLEENEREEKLAEEIKANPQQKNTLEQAARLKEQELVKAARQHYEEAKTKKSVQRHLSLNGYTKYVEITLKPLLADLETNRKNLNNTEKINKEIDDKIKKKTEELAEINGQIARLKEEILAKEASKK